MIEASESIKVEVSGVPVAIGVVNTGVDGQGTNGLTIDLNGNATPVHVATLLQALQYTSTDGGAHSFEVTLSDGEFVGAATSAVSTVTINVQDVPVNTVPGAQTAVDGTAKAITGVSVADADSATLTTTVSVNPGDGTLTASGGGTITGAGTESLKIQGSVAQVNAALATLSYTPAVNSTGAQTITVATTDGTYTDTDTIDVTVSDRPSIANLNGDRQTLTAVATLPLDLGGDAAVTDADSTDFDGGTLTIARAGTAATGAFSLDGTTATADGDGALADAETVSVNGTEIGTVSSAGQGTDDLVINLTTNATPALVGTLLQNILFTPDSVTTHSFGVTLSDGDGTTSDAARVTFAPPAPPPTPAPSPTPEPEPEPADCDDIPNDIEDSAPPPWEGGLTGDGNGDGMLDSAQGDVASLAIKGTGDSTKDPDAEPVYVTLVGGTFSEEVAPGGSGVSLPCGRVTLETMTLGEAPPPEDRDGIDMPLGLIGFKANAAISEGATDAGKVPFSLLIEKNPDLADEEQINGFWKQDSAGNWVNLASPEYGGKVTEVGGKIRLDFVIEDNGPFDSNPAAGAITDPGAPGYRAEPLVTPPYLPDSNDRILIDGAAPRILDFGGQDTYTLATTFIGNVRLVDNQASVINLPAGLVITDARFLADGLELSLPGGTLRLLGAPEASRYVFGGDPDDPAAGTALSFTELAHALGTTVPAPGRNEPHQASISGTVQADGTIAGGPGRTHYLDHGDSRLVVDGGDERIIDFGGADTYQLPPELTRDVTLIDNQVSRIELPEDTAISSAHFLADGLAMTIQDHTVTLLGAPQTFMYMLGEAELDYTELAEVLGPDRANTDALNVAASFASNIDWDILPL
ncbi:MULTISPECIES: hypothetical protein [Thiorhodovibrio]|uniref:hypothetical protein n=1 Tax=Thiorhodovibrio TaxID=61593 RepID=UPI001912ECFA|nr:MULTISPECIES: hypothetical protein [Thiorhodovibrio]MBK5969232.1 hypothetical protein [Thiorhodovibrio winogradskyi]WPL11223.1 Type V secretory pathway, adhesin AidA [Thiorhodovibrio litoralis]